MTTLSKPPLVGWGAVGIVYQITNDIAVKRAFADDDDGIHNEYRIYDMLDSLPYCPNIVRSFYRIPSANFLQYLSGGCIEYRLRQHQVRDPSNNRVTGVKKTEPQSLIWRWMAELADAIAWLESLGYVHGDIRPGNLVLDGQGHVKVVDFDNATKSGSLFDGCQPPYARMFGDGDAGPWGTWGEIGARTESFAMGSVFYYMTRGYEPYDDEYFGKGNGMVMVDRLQEKKFPRLNDDATDTIIHKCWHGEYESIKDLKLEVVRLHPDIRLSMAKAMPEEEYEARRQECMRAVESGVLRDTPRDVLQ